MLAVKPPHTTLLWTSREAQSFWHLVNWHICYMLLQRTMIGVYRKRDRPMKEKKDPLQSSWLCTMTRVGTERERERASDCLKWCHKSQPERKHWWPLLSSCPLPLTPPPARVRRWEPLALSRCILYCTFMHFKSRRPILGLPINQAQAGPLKRRRGERRACGPYRQCSERSHR